MNFLTNRWRTSLLFRVISTTFILSILLISATGSALYFQISNGIYKEKTNGSVVEAQSLIQYSQEQLYSTEYIAKLKVKDVIANIVRSTDQTLTSSPRDVVLVGVPIKNKKNSLYNSSTGGIPVSSIPTSLRKKVEHSTKIKWSRDLITFTDGSASDAIIVGSLIDIPNQPSYELYYIFLLSEQETILSLVVSLLWFTGIFLVLFIGLLSWYVVRQTVNPVRAAAQIAEKLTAGDLDRRMMVRGKDEMARLAISFNEMAVSMQQQISRLENLSRLQQRFVSDVSHELRTPLTTIRMASQVIFDGKEQLDSSAARSAELLMSQIARFELLLTDLLEVSRFDASASILESSPVDIKALVSRTIDQLQPENGKQIKSDFPEGEVIAEVDPRRIERVMRNLIANAIDHSEDKPIVITIKDSDTEVAVAVRDYGIGFTESEAKRLFDRFWRADPSRSRIRGGTGLGLAISLDDAKLHQGTLVAWGSPSNGAQFVLTVPKLPGIPIQNELIPANPNLTASTNFLSFNEDDI